MFNQFVNIQSTEFDALIKTRAAMSMYFTSNAALLVELMTSVVDEGIG